MIEVINSMKNKHCLLTNDVETTSILNHCLSDKTGEKVLKEGMPVLLGLYEKYNVKATFFFTGYIAQKFPEIVKMILPGGHEVGCHYEDLSLCRGNFELAIINFESSLEKLRKIYPVQTICMHGNAFRQWDNRSLWDIYNYKDYGIICEPYLDLDFNKILYLTDTGQKWNGKKYSIRDKIKMNNLSDKYNFESTKDILSALDADLLPNKILINIYPERWQNNFFLWSYFYLEQFIKRNIKMLVLKKK
jgi:hypothetical protein